MDSIFVKVESGSNRLNGNRVIAILEGEDVTLESLFFNLVEKVLLSLILY